MPGFGIVFTSEEAEQVRAHAERWGFRYPNQWIKFLVMKELEAWEQLKLSHPSGKKAS